MTKTEIGEARTNLVRTIIAIKKLKTAEDRFGEGAGARLRGARGGIPQRREDGCGSPRPQAEVELRCEASRGGGGMKKIFAIAATAVALSALAGCYIGKAEFKGEDMKMYPFFGTSAVPIE